MSSIFKRFIIITWLLSIVMTICFIIQMQQLMNLVTTMSNSIRQLQDIEINRIKRELNKPNNMKPITNKLVL